MVGSVSQGGLQPGARPGVQTLATPFQQVGAHMKGRVRAGTKEASVSHPHPLQGGHLSSTALRAKSCPYSRL
jgi:hypothetical protein